jgi:uncharacterized membrane protein
MDLKRFWRHVRMSPIEARRCFPDFTLEAIRREVAASELRHRGEVCFVVEAELTGAQLWRDLGSRQRAREVFAAQGVWNTEENNGVLIYVLLADHKVEVVADRGLDRRVKPEEWQSICQTMERHFRERRFEEGALAGVHRVTDLLVREFPAAAGTEHNELGDRPILM